eukprot:gene14866-15003_t
MSKRVGVLTSGGDCAGLNAAIRAITYHAQETYGWTVIGIRKGTTGLINRPLEYIELTLNHCDSMMLRSGGTMLGSTNKDDPFSFPNSDGTRNDRSGDFIAGYHDLGLDALIGIGGDGSMRILRRLAQKEIAIGYATALDVATEALDRLQPTAASHQRVMVLEVMGRDAGHIAIGAGVAGGADNPSKKKMEKQQPLPLMEYVLVTVALVNIWRGGQPSAWDRVIASAFGVTAVNLIAQNKFDRMVAWQHRQVIDIPIADAIDHYQAVQLDEIMVKTAKSLGIYLGELD